jgi:predicted DNA-binding transcriptional regulator AlpA
MSEHPPDNIELWDRPTVLRFFGGTRPLHVSTLYRGMHAGRYPRPIHIGGRGGPVRWLASECRAALQRMLSARDQRKHKTLRGRQRLQHIV